MFHTNPRKRNHPLTKCLIKFSPPVTLDPHWMLKTEIIETMKMLGISPVYITNLFSYWLFKKHLVCREQIL